MPAPAKDEAELAALVLEVLKDPAAYRRFLGRLRPKLVGRAQLAAACPARGGGGELEALGRLWKTEASRARIPL